MPQSKYRLNTLLRKTSNVAIYWSDTKQLNKKSINQFRLNIVCNTEANKPLDFQCFACHSKMIFSSLVVLSCFPDQISNYS